MRDVADPAGLAEGLEIIIDGLLIVPFILIIISIETEGHDLCGRVLSLQIGVIDIIRVITDGIRPGLRKMNSPAIHLLERGSVNLSKKDPGSQQEEKEDEGPLHSMF
jgi:hypothetical protein